MDQSQRLARIVEPALEGLGYALVRLTMIGQRRPKLQIMAERRDDQPMTVDDCVAISRHLSALLDVEDPIQEAYDLEVSSPGIDRPLTRIQDYERFRGLEAQIELKQAIEGQRRFRGRLAGIPADGQVALDLAAGPMTVAYDDIAKAKLVLTDELLAAAEARRLS